MECEFPNDRCPSLARARLARAFCFLKPLHRSPLKSPRYPQFLCREAERNRIFGFLEIFDRGPRPLKVTAELGDHAPGYKRRLSRHLLSLVRRLFGQPYLFQATPRGEVDLVTLPHIWLSVAPHSPITAIHIVGTRRAGYLGCFTSHTAPCRFQDLCWGPRAGKPHQRPANEPCLTRQRYSNYKEDCLCSPARDLPSVFIRGFCISQVRPQ